MYQTPLNFYAGSSLHSALGALHYFHKVCNLISGECRIGNYGNQQLQYDRFASTSLAQITPCFELYSGRTKD